MATDNQTQTGTDTAEADLLALAMKADSGEFISDDVPEGTEPEIPESASAGEPEETPEGKKADEAEKPEDKTPEPKENPKPGEATKPEEESQYSKARKEQERRDRSWKKLEEEKARLNAEREKLEGERREHETKRQNAEVYRDGNGFSAEDYEDFAKRTDDPEFARKANERAAALRKEEGEKRGQASREEFQKGWNDALNAAIEKNEELKDDKSELGTEVRRVLKEIPVFSMAPDGITHAVAYAKANLQSGLVASLTEENQKLKTEIDRLNKLTSIGDPGGPSHKPTVKSFEEMTSAEQEADLKRRAEEADRGGG